VAGQFSPRAALRPWDRPEAGDGTGHPVGRKPKLTPHQVKEALARREEGEPLVEIGRSCNVSHSTISGL
jgi:hypothetical protein